MVESVPSADTVYSSLKRFTRSPMIQNDYACVPHCKPCRDNGTCGKAFDAPITDTVRVRQEEWAPNRLPLVQLPCGCRDIPWPLVHYFGTNVYALHCDIHGEQRITAKNRKEFQQQTRIHYAEYESASASTLDIPPF